ncbi:translation elongation factor Ts [Bacteroidia bacterium]|nr:translation elongation factor Ts [Bacteroidia bacterium]MDB9881909.1 translation elongation factor Ts [Bacteroidia bacterium]MDC1394900.1 translation elongation factor Ts [Bacteroidia bacterium]
MTTITASLVNKLRQMTGAGMMDCKKALQETDGDIDGAVDVLRKKGAAKAAKRADRDAAEGLSIAKSSGDNTFGIVVEVNCETDFVAKNDDFSAFAHSIADYALENKVADKDALLATPWEGKTLGEILIDKTAVIGEKIEVSNYALVASEGVAAYNHGANRIGVLVALNSNDDTALSAGGDLAMQIAAMNPIAVDADAVPQEVKDKELKIGREIAEQEGKPEVMLDKIAQGKLQRYYKDNTLMAQSFVKDGSMNVAAFLKSVNPDLKVKSFTRFQLGA